MVDDLLHQDAASQSAYAWAERSFAFRAGLTGQPMRNKIPQFSSWLDLGNQKIAVSSDGIGTKVEVAERMEDLSSLGFDLMAMVTDDLAANGVEPFALTNTLDVNRVDSGAIEELMKGLHDAAKVAHVSVIGGEIAELGGRIQGFGHGMHLNWCATAIGLLRPGWAPLDGSQLRSGDAIITLESQSFRSNGYSTLRRGLTKQYGDAWHSVEWQNRAWGWWLLQPCRIYAPLVVALRSAGVSLKGLAHITGGGIPSKLGRTLRANNLAAELSHLFAPPEFMQAAQALCGVTLIDAYRHWNMGNGFMLIVDAADCATTIEHCCRAGYLAQQAGIVIDGPTAIHLKATNGTETLSYSV
jgi:phosphoribosylformylglycinamidine cyclo-ligase